jgi:hypothetical protein
MRRNFKLSSKPTPKASLRNQLLALLLSHPQASQLRRHKALQRKLHSKTLRRSPSKVSLRNKAAVSPTPKASLHNQLLVLVLSSPQASQLRRHKTLVRRVSRKPTHRHKTTPYSTTWWNKFYVLTLQ